MVFIMIKNLIRDNSIINWAVTYLKNVFFEICKFLILDHQRYIFLKKYILNPLNLNITKVKWLNEQDRMILKILRNETESTVAAPNFTNETYQSRYKYRLPELRIYKFKNVKMYPGNSAIHSEDNDCIYIDKHANFGSEIADYRGGPIVIHDNLYAITKKSKDCIQVEDGYYLGLNGYLNFYHFLIEIFGTIIYLGENGREHIKRIFIPSDALNILQFREILDIAKIKYGLSFNFIPKSSIHFKNLYYINCPHILPFNTRNGEYAPSHSVFDLNLIDKIKNLVIENNQVTNLEYGTNIFLCRRSKNRIYNQDEIFKHLETRGFQKVFLEDHSIYAQAIIFQKARIIVGPTGAEWTNLLFVSSGTKALCWMARKLKEFSVFSTIADHNGCELRYLTYKTSNNNTYRAKYRLLPSDIISKLDEMRID